MANRMFQIISGVDEMVSKTIATATPYGMGMEIDSSDETKATRAYGTGFQGFCLQEVTTAGPSALQLIAGVRDLDALAAASGTNIGYTNAITLACGEGLIEVEATPTTSISGTSNLIITAGTGAITGATAMHTELSFRGGKWRVAQAGDRVCGEMIDAALTNVETAGNVRCLIRVFSGGIKS